MTPGTTPRVRHRPEPSLPMPLPRMRTRTFVPPEDNGPIPPKKWCSPHNVPDGLSAAELCALGEVDLATHPSKWRGWPNGSLYQGRLGNHRGRVLRTVSGKYHALRWSPFSKQYVFVRTVKDHASALIGL